MLLWVLPITGIIWFTGGVLAPFLPIKPSSHVVFVYAAIPFLAAGVTWIGVRILGDVLLRLLRMLRSGTSYRAAIDALARPDSFATVTDDHIHTSTPCRYQIGGAVLFGLILGAGIAATVLSSRWPLHFANLASWGLIAMAHRRLLSNYQKGMLIEFTTVRDNLGVEAK